MNLASDSSTTQFPTTREQEIRRFTGEALRVGIPWNQHPAWSIIAERHGNEARTPPPAFTAEEIRALIAGPGHRDPCPRCGYVAIEER